MSSVWRYLGSDGQSLGSSEPFEDRGDAEAWLGEAWSGLLGDGVEEVALEEDGREVYRMGLREA
jgi:hypothetical protein